MGLEQEIRELEKRFSEAPDSRLFLPLADAFKRAGELERAAELCREGLERFPDFTSARILLGECLTGLGETEEAQQTMEKLAEEDSENVLVLKNLADLAERRGDNKKAESLYQKVYKLETGQAELPAGDLSISEEQEMKAEGTDEKKAIPVAGKKQAPGEIFLTQTLADIYRLQGHYDKAHEIYSKLIGSNDEDSELKRKLDDVRSHLENAKRAESDEVDDMEPDDETPSEPEIESSQAPETVIREPEEERVAVADEDRFEERIDRIFHFLLGDEPAVQEPSVPAKEGKNNMQSTTTAAGPDQFVDMLEDWITGLKESEEQ